jgi:hypothetical protein
VAGGGGEGDGQENGESGGGGCEEVGERTLSSAVETKASGSGRSGFENWREGAERGMVKRARREAVDNARK